MENMVGGTAALVPLAIGDAAYGGKIFYILVSGDPGYDANTQHGLIAATSDQSTGIQWNNGSYTTTGATGTSIGTGLANTNAIIANQGATSTNYAAGLARAYRGGGFTDWYLPSNDELDKLYINKDAIGGFSGDYYWSSSALNWGSSEEDDGNAWGQFFYDGSYSINDKFNTNRVRAVRAF